MNVNNDNAKEIPIFHDEYTNLIPKEKQFLSKKHNLHEIITDDFEKDLNISGIENNINEENKMYSNKNSDRKNSKIRKETLTNQSLSKDFSEDLNEEELLSRRISINSLQIDEISQIANRSNKNEIRKTSTKKITKEDLDNIPLPVFSCIYCSNETIVFKHFSEEILENKYFYQTSIYDIQELDKLIMYQPLIDKGDKNEKLLDIVIKNTEYINKYYSISEINNYFKSDTFEKTYYKLLEDRQKSYITKIEEWVTKVKKDSYFKGINIISKNSYNNKCLFNSTNSLINNYNALGGFVEIPLQINNNNNINAVKNSYNVNNTVGASCSNTSLNFNSLSLNNINNNEIGCLCKDNNILDNIVENIEKNSQSGGDVDDKDEIIMDFFGFNTAKKIKKDQIIWDNTPYDIWNPVINDNELNENYKDLSIPHLIMHDSKIDNEDYYELNSNNNIKAPTLDKRKKNNVIKNITHLNFKETIPSKDGKQKKLKVNLSSKNNNKFTKNKYLIKKDNSISLKPTDINNQKQSFSNLKSICSSTNNSSNINLNFMNKSSKSRSKINSKNNGLQKYSLQYIYSIDDNIPSNNINNEKNENNNNSIYNTKSFYSSSIANRSISMNSNKLIPGNSIKLQSGIKYLKNNSTSINLFDNGSILKESNSNRKIFYNKSKTIIKPKENKKTLEKTKSTNKIIRKKNPFFTTNSNHNFKTNIINNFNKINNSNINLTSSNKRINSGIISNIIKHRLNKNYTGITNFNKFYLNEQNHKSVKFRVNLFNSSLNLMYNNSPKKISIFAKKRINSNNHRTIGEFRKNTLSKITNKKNNLTGYKSKKDFNTICTNLEKDFTSNKGKNKSSKINPKIVISKNINNIYNKKKLPSSNSCIVKDTLVKSKKNN